MNVSATLGMGLVLLCILPPLFTHRWKCSMTFGDASLIRLHHSV